MSEKKDLEILKKLVRFVKPLDIGVTNTELDDFFFKVERAITEGKPKCDKKVILYTDAAARGNPGPAGIGVIVMDDKKRVLKDYHEFIGERTNNAAEYIAFIKGLEIAREMNADELEVYTDSELLANQINGVYKVKNKALIELYIEAKRLINFFQVVETRHIVRAKNRDADKLANLAIDAHQ